MSTGIYTRVRKALGRRGAKWLSRRLFTMPPGKPIISFTFDDFPRSALFAAGAMLEKAGCAGTYYTSLGLMGQVAPTGQIFRPEDLPLVIARGHELGCHTFEHCPAWETKTADYEASIRRNAAALSQYVPASEFQTHSFPVSFPPVATKRVLSRYFRGCRCGGQTFNSGSIDLDYLSAFFIEQSRDDFGAIERIIARNAEARGWLIFATHDVTDTPTPYGCTPALFEKVLRYSLNSGARILPVAQALDQMMAPPVSGRARPALQHA